VGAAGPQGPQGPQGPAGAVGPQGPAGIDGVDGVGAKVIAPCTGDDEVLLQVVDENGDKQLLKNVLIGNTVQLCTSWKSQGTCNGWTDIFIATSARLEILPPGTYGIADGFACSFTVLDGEIQ